jgi:hypothetical protein
VSSGSAQERQRAEGGGTARCRRRRQRRAEGGGTNAAQVEEAARLATSGSARGRRGAEGGDTCSAQAVEAVWPTSSGSAQGRQRTEGGDHHALPKRAAARGSLPRAALGVGSIATVSMDRRAVVLATVTLQGAVSTLTFLMYQVLQLHFSLHWRGPERPRCRFSVVGKMGALRIIMAVRS